MAPKPCCDGSIPSAASCYPTSSFLWRRNGAGFALGKVGSGNGLRTNCALGGADEDSDLTIAVNISAFQFRQPDFVRSGTTAVDRTGANPQATSSWN